MKQVVMAAVLGFGMAALSGCAELQSQGGGFFPQSQPQRVAVEGGQPVQSIGGTQPQGSGVPGAMAEEGSSMASDMAKEATRTIKNEVGSSIRSAIRGAFGR